MQSMHANPRQLDRAVRDQQLDRARFIRSLRSVRRFAPTPIPDDVLRDILDIARWTGSSKNTQPWELVVVRDRARLRELAACGTFASHLADAALGLVLVMDDDNRRLDEGRLAQNIMLAAWAYGIGSCIATLQPADNIERARQLLNVPAGRGLRTALSLGYPADGRALRRSLEAGASGVPIGRKPMVEFVSWETFGQRRPGP
jgi:nitroreductase